MTFGALDQLVGIPLFPVDVTEGLVECGSAMTPKPRAEHSPWLWKPWSIDPVRNLYGMGDAGVRLFRSYGRNRPKMPVNFSDRSRSGPHGVRVSHDGVVSALGDKPIA